MGLLTWHEEKRTRGKFWDAKLNLQFGTVKKRETTVCFMCISTTYYYWCSWETATRRRVLQYYRYYSSSTVLVRRKTPVFCSLVLYYQVVPPFNSSVSISPTLENRSFWLEGGKFGSNKRIATMHDQDRIPCRSKYTVWSQTPQLVSSALIGVDWRWSVGVWSSWVEEQQAGCASTPLTSTFGWKLVVQWYFGYKSTKCSWY